MAQFNQRIDRFLLTKPYIYMPAGPIILYPIATLLTIAQALGAILFSNHSLFDLLRGKWSHDFPRIEKRLVL